MTYDKGTKPLCNERRKCFAQSIDSTCRQRCEILNDEIVGRPCPFCKPIREISNGKYYPAPMLGDNRFSKPKPDKPNPLLKPAVTPPRTHVGYCSKCYWYKQESPNIYVCSNPMSNKLGMRVKGMSKCGKFELGAY